MRRMSKGITDQFLTWAFTILRAILMIVYAIVLIVFVYRVGQDRERIDLEDKIKQEQTIISLTEANEKTYRNLQNKLIQTEVATKSTEATAGLMESIIRLATGKILFTNLDIDTATIQMDGSARSIAGLNSFIDELKKIPAIKAVNLDRLESRVDQGIIVFRLSAAL